MSSKGSLSKAKAYKGSNEESGITQRIPAVIVEGDDIARHIQAVNTPERVESNINESAEKTVYGAKNVIEVQVTRIKAIYTRMMHWKWLRMLLLIWF